MTQKTMHWQGAGRTATAGDAVAPRRIHPGGDRREGRRTPPPSFAAICSRIRDSICPGESPDVQEACFIQMAKNDFNPEPGQFDPRHPPLAGTSSPEEAAASWKERRIYDPMVDGYGPQLKL